MKLLPLDADYPRSLFHLDQPPELTLSGPLEQGRRVIAIAGARDATKDARDFAYVIAYHLAKAGIIVVSGGASGIDEAAHRGAIGGGGTTWCVACTGRGKIYPTQNERLFAEIEASSSSRMIWPFPDGTVKDKLTPRSRNGVLVGLAEAVVVIQARERSGSRNSITWARRLGRRIFIIPGQPWDFGYEGSTLECLRGGVDIFWSLDDFFDKLELPRPDQSDPMAERGKRPLIAYKRARPKPRQTYSEAPLFPVDPSTWSANEKLVFSELSMAPIQQETILERVGLPTSSTLTALLTLSLKDVVVEGPDGFFRRRIAL
ncbi:MAG: Rossmann fold nucleotide-binding protein Smf [Labilithrix sp.]|nr:Rossmann fold nucleotide-binding protein Smf [Labilithrix sp.]